MLPTEVTLLGLESIDREREKMNLGEKKNSIVQKIILKISFSPYLLLSRIEGPNTFKAF